MNNKTVKENFPTAHVFWNGEGMKKFPILSKVAIPLTELKSSSAGIERIWSIFKLIHSKGRNRLTDSKVDNLVFMNRNSKALDEIKTSKCEESMNFEVSLGKPIRFSANFLKKERVNLKRTH